jgi:hypothetical protein
VRPANAVSSKIRAPGACRLDNDRDKQRPPTLALINRAPNSSSPGAPAGASPFRATEDGYTVYAGPATER